MKRRQRAEVDRERIVSLDVDGEWVGNQRLSLSLGLITAS